MATADLIPGMGPAPRPLSREERRDLECVVLYEFARKVRGGPYEGLWRVGRTPMTLDDRVVQSLLNRGMLRQRTIDGEVVVATAEGMATCGPQSR